MAQKKITISLTGPQFEHVKQAVRDAQDSHQRNLGRANAQLTAAQKAFDKAENPEPESEPEPELEAEGDTDS